MIRITMIDNVSDDATPLRDAHRAATRRRILRAVSDLLAEEHPAALSIPAVAARSGVSVPTIYRYFPTKEALLDAVGTFGEELVWGGGSVEQLDVGAIDRWVQETWSRMLRILPLVKAQHMSPVGRDVRRRRGEQRGKELRASLRANGIDPASETGRRLEALAGLLISSSALIQLHDTQGVPLEQAAAYASWAIKELLAATTREEQGYGT
jgi:AcrR family transcriptional regulator